MAPRADDSSPVPLDAHASVTAVKFTREVPLWGVISVIAGLGAQAVALYYGQQRLAERMSEVVVEVKALSASNQVAAVERERVRLMLDDMGRRLAEVESRTNGRPPAAPIR